MEFVVLNYTYIKQEAGITSGFFYASGLASMFVPLKEYKQNNIIQCFHFSGSRIR